jgi:hypothetical protein
MASLDNRAELLEEYFIYSKAVNARVCSALTASTGRLSTVVTANDFGGIDFLGGEWVSPSSNGFRGALSDASKHGDALFPTLAGPTVLCNLPRVVAALTGIFRPLFPPSVQKILVFARVEGLSGGLGPLLTHPSTARAFTTNLDAVLDRYFGSSSSSSSNSNSNSNSNPKGWQLRGWKRP